MTRNLEWLVSGLVIILLALVGSQAAAQTISGVSGDPIHGTPLIISGSGFGDQPIATESFFESWDWGENGTPVSQAGSPWTTAGADSDPARFSNEYLRGGHGKNLRVVLPDPESGSSLNDMVIRSGLDIRPGDKVYINNFFWSTYAGADEFGSDCPQQWKIWNWLMHDMLTGPATAITWNESGMVGPPNGDPAVEVFHMCGSGSAIKTSMSRDDVQPPVNTWWQVEIEYQVGTAQYAEDGYLRVWFDGEMVGERSLSSWCSDDYDARVQADGYVYNDTVLRNYVQWNGCAIRPDTVRHDDTTIQIGSWARVALGDDDQWSQCTRREYQPVVNWSPTQVVIELNRGAFMPGETAYLYVITDDGDPSGSSDGILILPDDESGGGDEGAPWIVPDIRLYRD